MKVGDLVAGAKDKDWEGCMGIIIGFDPDNDPIVLWTGPYAHEGSILISPGCGEYRSQLKVINEAR